MHTHRNYADTHSDTHEVPARRTSPGPSASCLAVTVACCARERGRTRLKRAVTQPTKDHDRVSWWHTHTHTQTETHKLTKGWVWITALCLFVWIPDMAATLPMQMPTQMPTNVCVCVCVCVCICVCKCVFGQGKSDGYNAHTSGVCLIGEQTSRLACLHTAGCNACTVGHTHTHTHTHTHFGTCLQSYTDSHINMHEYTHTHTNTHQQTHTPLWLYMQELIVSLVLFVLPLCAFSLYSPV